MEKKKLETVKNTLGMEKNKLVMERRKLEMEKSKWVPAVHRREAERIQLQELGQKTEGCKCFLETERNKAASRSLELARSMEDCKLPEAEASN